MNDSLIAKALKSNLTPAQLEKMRKHGGFSDLVGEMERELNVNKKLALFITEDAEMKKVKDEVRILSEEDDPVLILGDTGTGKELIASALHGERKGPFVAVNCAGIPETLIESELFGHVQGAFTGAHKDKVGLLQAAYDGTIFLDEVAELATHVQAKLLRAIQEKAIRRVGADRSKENEFPINCRIITATHKNIKQAIKTEHFREDLFWRISTFTLTVKPLKDRTTDIPLIVKQLIIKERGNVRHEIEDINTFCAPIIANRDRLTGNVRQLQQIVRNYHVLGKLPKFD